MGTKSTYLGRAYAVFLHVFAIVGAVDLIGRQLLLPGMGTIFGYAVALPSGYEVQKVLASADGSMKAVAYVWSGSGFNPGCDWIVSVVERTRSENTAWKDPVYRASCNLMGGLRWEPSGGGRVYPRLRIDADAGKADFMARYAFDGRVAVAYPSDP